MEAEPVLPGISQDRNFARKIDRNCRHCLEGGGRGRQLAALNNRVAAFPKEQRVISRLKRKCGSCKGGEVENISALHSCIWR